MKYLRIVLVLLFFATNGLLAQRYHSLLKPCNEKLGFRHFITKTPWRVQLGWNMVDDDGRPFNNLFDVKNTWNLPAYPTKISIEKECNRNWNVELSLSYNSYKAGKTINGDVMTSGQTFFAADVNGKYILSKKYIAEPYLLIGLGYTMRTTAIYQNAATLNAGIGCNIWLIDNLLGLNIQASGKFGLQAPVLKTGSNYLQHSIGLVYKFSGNYKRLQAARVNLKRIYNK